LGNTKVRPRRFCIPMVLARLPDRAGAVGCPLSGSQACRFGQGGKAQDKT
jgi:hypothetical protein